MTSLTPPRSVTSAFCTRLHDRFPPLSLSGSCICVGYLGEATTKNMKKSMKTDAERKARVALLKHFIWLLIFSLQSTEEGKEAGIWGWVGQKFLDLKGK